jgi:hypothetical protein
MRISALGIALCVLFGCGGDDGPSEADFNAPCSKNSDCDDGQGLTCASAGIARGICSGMCNSDAECTKFGGDTKCVGGGVGAGYCYQTCTDSVECPRSHICTMRATEAFSTCRPSN